MMDSWKISVVLLCVVAHTAQGYSFYGNRIPNGKNVLHPCTPNIVWVGVGHYQHGGGGPRNQFGTDFALAGHTWTQDLCQKDSDNDGRSNGVELGDPDCVWTEGDTPAYNNVTHPGICEPVDSPQCQESGFTCDGSIGFECPALDEPGVQTLDLKLPVMQVPNQETTYICQTLAVNLPRAAHVVAFEPIIDNVNVLHHIVIYGCTEEAEVTDVPYSCGMSPPSCRSMLIVWSIGVQGGCVNPQAGVAIGPGAYEHLVLNVHWNNPELSDQYTDGSGLKLHYTENLRPFSAQTMNVGQLFLNVPPLQDRFVQTTVCKSQCTEILPEPMYVISALVHMHYLGAGGRIEVFRGGELVDMIVNDESYNYEDPLMHEFDPPKVILPGDEIRVHCYFNSLDEPNRRTSPTYFGQATRDEMCFAFMMYYPGPSSPENSFICYQFGEIDACPGILQREACDGCYEYNVILETAQYLENTQTCASGCQATCLEHLMPPIRITCVMDTIAKLNARSSIPPEFQVLFDALNTCGMMPTAQDVEGHSKFDGHGVARMLNTRRGVFVEPVAASANDDDGLPTFEACGLDIGSSANRLSMVSVASLLTAAVSVWLCL